MAGDALLLVERDARALGQTRRHAAPALVFPLEATVVDLEVGPAQRLDRATFALVPAGVPHRFAAPQAGSVAVVTLAAGDAVHARVVAEYAPHVERRVLAQLVAAPRRLPRTRWIDELVQRYVFEREVCEKHDSAAARFLETELVKELYFLGREQLAQHTRASVLYEGSGVAVRARAWIEEHLFEPFAIAPLARAAGTSASTVLRAFRGAYGVAPAVYARRRRLEEAHHLLASGRYGVTEVAARVGYDNPSAFAVAFRAQFGMPPSRARAAPSEAMLPAHGLPPQPPRPPHRPRRRD